MSEFLFTIRTPALRCSLPLAANVVIARASHFQSFLSAVLAAHNAAKVSSSRHLLHTADGGFW